MTADRHNLLVISDLHLGEHLRAEAGADRAQVTDRALLSFLRHHAANRDGGAPWRLVINGDMVDFVAVRLMPDQAGLVRQLSDAEHVWGLGDGRVAAVRKMEAILEHHAPVFRELARFVGEGNRIEVVIGNHDAAFHWIEVQDLFRHALASHWEALRSELGGERTAQEVLDAVQFHPWFWFEEGVAWIEHGHQYDPYCSFDDVAAPDTQEGAIDQNIGAALMHFLGNHYLADMEAHWGGSFFGYLRFWYRQGLARGAAILGAYLAMCAHLAQAWWSRWPRRVAARRERNRARLQQLADRARLPVRVLLRLRSLHRRPAIADLDDITRAVMLDRLVLLALIPLSVAAVVVVRPDPVLAAVLAAALFGPLATLAARPRDPIDPRAAMQRVAQAIRHIASVPIVVFGHSHAAVAERVRGGWYFNTGSWVGDPDGPGRAFTHLRVVRTAAGPNARLCQWREGGSRELP